VCPHRDRDAIAGAELGQADEQLGVGPALATSASTCSSRSVTGSMGWTGTTGDWSAKLAHSRRVTVGAAARGRLAETTPARRL
jgi:hypothetical protein